MLGSIVGFLGTIINPKPITPLMGEDKTFFQKYGGVALLGIIMIIAFVVIVKEK